MPDPAGTPWQAAADALAAALEADRRLIVAGAVQAWPGLPAERTVALELPTAPEVAVGLAAGGRPCVLVLEPGGTWPAARTDLGGRWVALTCGLGAARGWWARGWGVLQAGWAQDTPGLLAHALRADTPTVLRLHDRAVGGPPARPGAPDPQRLRWLLRGTTAALVASGPALPAALEVGRRLIARGVPVGVAERCGFPPGAELPAEVDEVAFLGPADLPDHAPLAGLARVGLDDDPDVAVEQVLALLPARP